MTGSAPTGSPPPSSPPNLSDVLARLGIDPAAGPPPSPPPPSRPRVSSTPDREEAERRCIEYLKDVEPGIQGSNGSGATMWAARVVCWGFDLGEDDGFRILWDRYNPRCVPAWSEAE